MYGVQKTYSMKYTRKKERSKINDLIFYFKMLEKQQNNPKVSTREEVKTRAEISKNRLEMDGGNGCTTT